MNAVIRPSRSLRPLSQDLRSALSRRGFKQLQDGERGSRTREKQDRALETALMELFRDEGSEAAFHALYARAGPGLVYWVLHCMRGHLPVADPVEVAQDAWCGMVRYASSFNRGSRQGPFRSWARTIAANALRQRVRWIQRMETCDHRELKHERDAGRGPLGVAEDRDEALRVQQALLVLLVHLGVAFDGLAPRDKRILELLEMNKGCRAAVAEEMGVGRSGVKMILLRARKRLALALARSLGAQALRVAPSQALVRAAG
jgi:RNA polymerase sigma factor (sigma-70 family)